MYYLISYIFTLKHQVNSHLKGKLRQNTEISGSQYIKRIPVMSPLQLPHGPAGSEPVIPRSSQDLLSHTPVFEWVAGKQV